MASKIHPAENRGYRELYAAARQVADHWARLAPAFEGEDAGNALARGASMARDLLGELEEQTARFGLHGRPNAQGVGAALAAARGRVVDRFLERNQAMRSAVLDLEHVTTLIGYLGTVAESRGDEELVSFCGAWERKLRRQVGATRKAAIALGANPDAAVKPLDNSALGRAAHGAGWAVGTVGELSDRAIRRAAGRKPRRKPRRR